MHNISRVDSTPLERLPVEIYWRICNYLSYKDLSQLSIVGHALHNASIPPLYRSVTIDLKSSSLENILNSVVKYGEHVKKVRISTSRIQIENATGPANNTSWTANYSTHFTGLDVISPCGRCLPAHVPQYITSQLVSALRNLRHLVTFEWAMCEFHPPPDLISILLQLRSLQQFQTCVVPLVTDYMLDNIARESSAAPVHSLRILGIHSLEHAHVVGRLIRLFGSSLKSISIRVSVHTSSSAPASAAASPDPTALEFFDRILDTISLAPSSPTVYSHMHGRENVIAVSTLALFGFPRVNIFKLALVFDLRQLSTLRIDTSDPDIITTYLATATSLAPSNHPATTSHRGATHMYKPQSAVMAKDLQTIDLTFSCAHVSTSDAAQFFQTFLGAVDAVENINLKIQTAPMMQDAVLSNVVANWVVGLYPRRHRLRKLSVHIWSIVGEQHILLAPWTPSDLTDLAESLSGRSLASLAIDMSRSDTVFSRVVDAIKVFPAIRKLYLNYTPTVYFGKGIYDICRTQAITLKRECNLDFIWLNSVELKQPLRRANRIKPRNYNSERKTASSHRSSRLSPSSLLSSSNMLSSLPSAASSSSSLSSFADENFGSEYYDYNDDYENDNNDDIDSVNGYDSDELEDAINGHVRDDYFADDSNFHIIANRLF
ncbi:hypothetical protein V1511DRAFT_281390 [Dipodascopsis uninucleata]